MHARRVVHHTHHSSRTNAQNQPHLTPLTLALKAVFTLAFTPPAPSPPPPPSPPSPPSEQRVWFTDSEALAVTSAVAAHASAPSPLSTWLRVVPGVRFRVHEPCGHFVFFCEISCARGMVEDENKHAPVQPKHAPVQPWLHEHLPRA